MTTAASAQEARGRSTLKVGVADAETGQPLTGAVIEIPEVHLQGRAAGTMAEAVIRDLPAGALQVETHFFGYEPLKTMVYFSGTDTVESVMLMQRATVQLATVHVNAAATPTQMRQFRSHVDRGVGHFITDSTLERLGGGDLWGTIQARIPGVTTVWEPQDHVYVVVSKRGFTDFSFQPCPVQIVINGIIEPPASDGGRDVTAMSASEIAGVEFYDATEIPIEWRRLGSGCGLLAIWTKR